MHWFDRDSNLITPSDDMITNVNSPSSSSNKAITIAKTADYNGIISVFTHLLWSDLRPKGRGRPQRILLGVWPDEHIRGVIRAVVFRDGSIVKDEPNPMYPSLANYACNGPEGAVSPGAAAAAAVAAVAQGNCQRYFPSKPKLSPQNLFATLINIEILAQRLRHYAKSGLYHKCCWFKI